MSCNPYSLNDFSGVDASIAMLENRILRASQARSCASETLRQQLEQLRYAEKMKQLESHLYNNNLSPDFSQMAEAQEVSVWERHYPDIPERLIQGEGSIPGTFVLWAKYIADVHCRNLRGIWEERFKALPYPATDWLPSEQHWCKHPSFNQWKFRCEEAQSIITLEARGPERQMKYSPYAGNAEKSMYRFIVRDQKPQDLMARMLLIIAEFAVVGKDNVEAK